MSTVPSTITEDNISLINPKDIADAAFNNYFSNVATGIKSSIKYSRKKLFDFFPQIKMIFFFIDSTNKVVIKNIFFSSSSKIYWSKQCPSKNLEATE